MTTLTPRPAATAAPEPVLGALESAVKGTLDELGRSDTPDGAAALFAARMLEQGEHTGASAASLLREMRAAVAAATKGASSGADLVDELREKRRRRRAG